MAVALRATSAAPRCSRHCQASARRIHYHPAISPGPNIDDGWSGVRGFVHDVADELFGMRLAECEVYFAGPPLMGEAMQKMLHARGVPPEQIHFDQFY